MEKFKRFLAGIGSIFISLVGCYLFVVGFDNLFITNFWVNMFGGACMMVGVYDFFAGLTLLMGVIAGKKLVLSFFVVNDVSEKKEETDSER